MILFSVQRVQTVVSFWNPCKYTNAQIMDVQPQKGAQIVAFIALVTVSSWCVTMTLSMYFPANHNSKYQSW